MHESNLTSFTAGIHTISDFDAAAGLTEARPLDLSPAALVIEAVALSLLSAPT